MFDDNFLGHRLTTLKLDLGYVMKIRTMVFLSPP